MKIFLAIGGPIFFLVGVGFLLAGLQPRLLSIADVCFVLCLGFGLLALGLVGIMDRLDSIANERQRSAIPASD